MFTNTHSLKQVANFIPRPHSPSPRRYFDVLLPVVSKDYKRIYLKGFTKKFSVLQTKHIGIYSKRQEIFAELPRFLTSGVLGRYLTTNSLGR